MWQILIRLFWNVCFRIWQMMITAQRTIRDVYNILNAMFKYAVHNRILTFNPCAGVEVPKTKTKQIRVLTVKEQREVLEHAKERIHENLIQVALGTGMRGGDDDDKIRLNQRKPSKYKGLRRFGPEKTCNESTNL